jgi:hypothetical protein
MKLGEEWGPRPLPNRIRGKTMSLATMLMRETGSSQSIPLKNPTAGWPSEPGEKAFLP